MSAMPSALWLEALGRWAVYLPALAVLGLVAARWLVAARATEPVAAAAELACARAAAVASAALLAGVVIRLWCQTANLFEAAGAFSLENLQLVGFTSRWGGRWQHQLFAAAGCLASALCLRLWHRLGWGLYGAAALYLAASLPLTGHARADGLDTWLVQSVHVAGAGAWIGTLAVLWAGHRRLFAPIPQPELLRCFAPVASVGLAALAASGLFTSWRLLHALGDLATTGYGRLLSVKGLLVVAAAAFGALNHRRLRRPAAGESPRLALGRELLVASLILVLTAFLTSTSPAAHG